MASHFGVSLAIEIGFTNNAFTLDSATKGVLDTNRLFPDYVWTDVSSYVKSFTTNVGRDRNLERFSAGTCSLILDDTTDRRFDPTNVSGAYYPNVKPGIPLRIVATYATVAYPVWWGYIDSWQPSYIKGNPGGTEVEVSATDSFGLLAQNKPGPVASQGAGELSGARVSRILNQAGWPLSQTSIDAGWNTLIGTTLEDSALDELMVTMFSEGGSIYQNQAGTIVFEDRNAIFSNSASLNSQATFGDGAGELRYFDIEGGFDDELVKNDVSLETRPGKVIQRQDNASIATRGVRTWDVSGLMNQNAGQLQATADLVLALYAEPKPRFDSITIRPQRDAANLWPQVLGRDIHDRITIRRRPAGGGAAIELDCFIEGIRHSADAQNIWETTFSLSDAAADVFFTSPFILDSSELDGPDLLSF